ncbi:MAG: DUF2868 domain-containing protein [Gammaproteobacteria bacterium]|nr:DUF2868 domain-containing protein [Gammaproteobacteria bacterium]
MSAGRPDATASLFEDAIDVPVWLEEDSHGTFRARVQRDRTIGCGLHETRPLKRVRAWWRLVEAAPKPQLGSRLRVARAWVSFAVCGLGALVGGGVAAAALRYDGTYPVNVVMALALLVALPLLLFVGTLVLLPGWLPGVKRVQDLLAAVNVGNLVSGLFNRLAHERDALQLGWNHAGSGPAAAFAKWQAVVWSQQAGLCFSAAAVAVAFMLVVFTDLAFGWSTTLQITSTDAHSIVAAIAWPWSSWLPGAMPDSVLLEESRFFRLEDGIGGIGGMVAAGRLTGWWPFLVMSLVVYGVLPRLLLLCIAEVRLRSATRRMLLDDPRVTALLDRMDVALIGLDSGMDSGIDRGDVADVRVEETRRGAFHAFRHDGPVNAIAWNYSMPEDSAESSPGALPGGDIEHWLRAHVKDLRGPAVYMGGGNAPAHDRQVLQDIEVGGTSLVLMLTKAWEPPLLDCLDFLRALRGRLGRDVSIAVVPLGVGGGEAEGMDLAAWHQRVLTLGDGRTYVEGFAGGPAEGSDIDGHPS